MNRTPSGSMKRFIIGAAVGLSMLAGSASAQIWEAADGGAAFESGRGGVTALPGGGTISVGYTNSFGLATNNVYVVRSNANGSIAWSQHYELMGDDAGLDIHRCANGDFVITGVTDANGTDDLFILRIDGAGACLWARVWGGAGDDAGRDVTEAPNGDIVAVGWHTPVGAMRNGLIVRVDAAGANVYANTYAPAGGGGNDYFHGLDIAPNGDLVAVGGTTSFGNANQGWLLRTLPNGAIVWSSQIGGAANEEFNSVRVLTVGGQFGNIVAVGSTTGVPGDPQDMYITKWTPAGAQIFPDISAGTPAGVEEAFHVMETQVIAPAGSLIVTGHINPGPLGANDGYVMHMQPVWGCPAGKIASAAYGGPAGDRLFSADEYQVNCIPGFILCGATVSFAPVGDPQQHYLVKTNAALNSCNSLPVADRCTQPGYGWFGVNIMGVQHPAVLVWPVTCNPAPGGAVICFVPCPAAKGNLSENGTAAELSATYPNPVASGDAFQVEYTLAGGSEFSIMVSDISGQVVYQGSEESAAGKGSLSVSTEGWTAGTYLLKVDLGGDVQTRKIVVTGK